MDADVFNIVCVVVLFTFGHKTFVTHSHSLSLSLSRLQVEDIRDMKRKKNEKPFEDIPNFRLPLQTSDEILNCSNNSL
jgi:hypothetical protein